MKDIQKTTPTFSIPIDQVGVEKIKYPLSVKTKQGGYFHTVSDIKMCVSLSAKNKGTHMSRFIEILHSHYQFLEIDNLEILLNEIKNKLESHSSYIEISFPYFVNKFSPVSNKQSLMDYICCFQAYINYTECTINMSVEVPIISLCPCSKEISDYGAHNQRGIIKAKICISKNFMWIEDLLSIVERCGSSQIWSLLKRVDEKYITEQSYENPMFVEDIARKLANEFNSLMLPDYEISVTNYESIHNHNAFANIKKGMFCNNLF